MSGKQGLIAVQRQVIRNGKSFMTTVYIKPSQQKKVKSHAVSVPNWNLSSPSHVQDEIDKINKIKDPSEKKIVKEQFLDHVKKNGVTWSSSSNKDIDWMRGMMATKKHLSIGTQPVPTASNPKLTVKTVPKSVSSGKPTTFYGSGKPASKEDARFFVNQVKKDHSADQIMSILKKQGITWNEHTEDKINRMRAMMALREHFEKGNFFNPSGAKSNPAMTVPNTPSAKPAQPVQPKLVVPTVDKNIPKSGTLERDYYDASHKQKAIGFYTGILPTDQETEDYLIKKIKEDQFRIDAEKNEGIKLPKSLDSKFDRHSNLMVAINPKAFDYVFLSSIEPSKLNDDMYEGSPLENDYKEWKKKYREFDDKYSSQIMEFNMDGISLLKNSLSYLKNDLNLPLDAGGVRSLDVNRELSGKLMEISKSPGKTDVTWDKLDMDSWFEDRTGSNTSVLGNVLMFADGQKGNEGNLLRTIGEKLGISSTGINSAATKDAIIKDIKNKKLSKSSFIKTLSQSLNDPGYLQTVYTFNLVKPIEDLLGVQPSRYSSYEYKRVTSAIRNINYDQVNSKNNSFTADLVLQFLSEATTDMAKLRDEKGTFFEQNNMFRSEVERVVRQEKVKKFEDFETPDFEEWKRTPNKMGFFKKHLAVMRVNKDKRDKKRKSLDKKGDKVSLLDVRDAIDNGNFTAINFPDHKKISSSMKASLVTVPEAEAEKVKQKIIDSHDNVNHKRFSTVVNHVFRIKNLPIEDEFRKIDTDRNNTDFYYHGTDLEAAQKIIGLSGQFKVSKKNVKAGRLLGDGVYLAKQSSKSMQYASTNFGRHSSTGVLMLCKASLGKAVESTKMQVSYNTDLLNQPNVDTVQMKAPFVINPEWSVKNEQAVIPRLWIDVSRKYV